MKKLSDIELPPPFPPESITEFVTDTRYSDYWKLGLAFFILTGLISVLVFG